MRVSQGGHDVEPHLINECYFKCLDNLQKVKHLCDNVFAFNNTYNFEMLFKTQDEIWIHKKEIDWIKVIKDSNK